MQSFFREMFESISPNNLSLEEVEKKVSSLLPVYWPGNFDERRRHVVSHDRYDIDICDVCRNYDEVYYWTDGAGVNERGEVVLFKQYPSCRRCQPR